MYNGEVNVTEEFLPVLLKTADILRICGLSTNDSPETENEVWYFHLNRLMCSNI